MHSLTIGITFDEQTGRRSCKISIDANPCALATMLGISIAAINKEFKELVERQKDKPGGKDITHLTDHLLQGSSIGMSEPAIERITTFDPPHHDPDAN